MSKLLNDLTRSIKSKLKNYDDLKGLESTIITVELMSVGCELIDNRLPFEEAWSLLTGYGEPIITGGANLQVLGAIRMLLSHTTGKTNWERLVKEYFEIPKEHRLLEYNEDGHFSFIVPHFDPERKQEYEKILCSEISSPKNELKFVKSGAFTYTKRMGDQQTVYKGVIPKQWVKESSKLPKKKEKKKVEFQLPFEWEKIAQEMDLATASPNSNWLGKVKPMTLQSTTGEKTFEFGGLQHIGGGLAAGKSTFRAVSTYWLTTNQNVKVGIVESSVAKVMQLVSEQRALGIKAVAIIGPSDRRTHQEQHLYSNPIETVTDLANDPSLAHLSDLCTIQALAGDNNQDGKNYYPCKSLKAEGESARKVCPLSQNCGVYKEWTELIDADVWVTTSAAVLHTRLPAMVDPYERILYEAMYDLLDVVFIDEADEVQKQFDNTFLSELNVFGRPNYFIEQLSRDLQQMTDGKYNLSDDRLLMNWLTTSRQVSNVVWQFYTLLNSSMDIQNYLNNKVVYLNFIISDIGESLSKEIPLQESITEEMRSFVKESIFIRSGGNKRHLHMLLNNPSAIDSNEVIEDWLTSMELDPTTLSNKNKIYSKIKLFVYLAYIERSMKFFENTYPILQSKYTHSIDFPLLRSIEDFRPFLEEAMTGVMFGYRYERDDGERIGTFKMIQYTAVGRELLYKWPTVYKDTKGTSGPAVILLSGTSYAPKSLHYHIREEPKWFIRSERQCSKLTQTALILTDKENNEEPISVSGTGIGALRNDNLYKLTTELERHIEKEITYWKEQGENRRVLLVVNSYKDVDTVGQALERSKKWRGNYRLLAKEKKNGGKWYPRSLVEDFYKVDEQILVVPLLSVSRGYNIMDEFGKSALFGSAFFLIRPYPIPNDLSYFVQVLHGNLPRFLGEIEDENLIYGDAMKYLRRKSRALFNTMYQNPDFWSHLTKKESTVLAWYTFIPTWQMIGRLLRGGKDARIFYCDAKFQLAYKNQPSLLQYWEELMNANNDAIFDSLYGPFKESIGDAVKERMVL